MNDFGTQLTALLDDAAAGIEPHPDFDAVWTSTVPVVSNEAPHRRRFRRASGIAAAAVALLGGGVAAYQVAGDDDPTVLVTAPDDTVPADPTTSTTAVPVTSDRDRVRPDRLVPAVSDRPSEAPANTELPGERFERTAELGEAALVEGVIHQEIHGRAEPGEFVTAASDFGSMTVEANEDGVWDLLLKLTEVPEDQHVVSVRVTFGRSDVVRELEVERPVPEEPEQDEPKTEEPRAEEPRADEPKAEEPKHEEPKAEEPKHEEPAPIPFTVNRADQYDDATHMKQVFYGTAPAGAVVYAQSEWGSTHVTAGAKGHWELHLVLADVPDDTVVHVVVRANTGGAFEYDLVRSKPAPEREPEPVGFTSKLGEGHLGGSPMEQVLYGRGAPGSGVVARTEYGSEDAVVGPGGHWEMVLRMYEVPAGTKVGVRVTNTASDRVYEYSLKRPAGEPEPVDFTAEAAFEECDSNPPFNEYWGRSTAGAKITISSPYGGGQVTSNGDGHWEARIEFPEAPVGETFVVRITSSKGSAVYEFPLTRV